MNRKTGNLMGRRVRAGALWAALATTAACTAAGAGAAARRGGEPDQAAACTASAECAAAPRRALDLPPGPNNPRNSEGDFAVLKDGRILFIYSHYVKGTGDDNDPAHLASRVSSDGGKTWSTNSVEVVANEGGLNVMSVSTLRLKDGALALFYLRKNSLEDCRAVMRVSRDEGKTWGPPRLCIPDAEKGYYVLNNNRAQRLASGRIVLPFCVHGTKNGRIADWAGKLVCYFSDDDGATWRRGKDCFETYDAQGKRVTTQEPGVVELKDGRLLMYARTSHGRQWFYYSSDGGDTWTRGEPGTLVGPCAPATVKRLANGDLLAVWNDHERHPEQAKQGPKWAAGARTPLTLAISKDEGKTWIHRRDLEPNPKGWYCYIAVLERKGELLLGYCAGEKMLAMTRVTRVPLAWLYGGEDKPAAGACTGGECAEAEKKKAGGGETLITEGTCAAVSPDGRTVAFQRYAGEVMKLGLCDLATGCVTWLEEGPGMAAHPAWTPDGALVYTQGHLPETAHVAWKTKSTAGYHLRIWEKGAKRDLTAGRCRDYTPTVTPDGRTIYFASTRDVRLTSREGSAAASSTLAAIDRAGGTPRLVVPMPSGDNSGVVNPAVSPDGRLLVWGHLRNFFGYWRVYGAKVDDTSPSGWAPLTPEGLVATSPRWHPNGRLLAFTGFRKGDPGWGVWVEDVRTGRVRRLCDGENPSFSPDGSFLVYDRARCVWRRDFTAADEPVEAFPAAAEAARPPEKVLAKWVGNWTRETELPLGDAGRFAFGRETPFFVRVRARMQDVPGVRMFFQGSYGESPIGILLYRHEDLWFATRDASGRFKGTKRMDTRSTNVVERTLTGIRCGGEVCLSLDGDLPRVAAVGEPLGLDTPKRFTVGKDLKAGEAVLSVEVGTGWPNNVPRGKTREEVVK